MRLHIPIIIVGAASTLSANALANETHPPCPESIPQLESSNADSRTGFLASLTHFWWNEMPYLPHGDSDSMPFIDTVRLALSPTRSPPQHFGSLEGIRTRHSHLAKRAQGSKVTKCRVQSSLDPTPGDDGDSTSTSSFTRNWTPTDSNGVPMPTETIGEGHGGAGEEIISITEPCGDIPVGATVNTNTTNGPNGQISWITCGINRNDNSTGWSPPYATIYDIITFTGTLKEAIDQDGSPFKPCEQYVDLFEEIGHDFDIPPLFIASFAMQESTCNPETIGGGGEQGMMQLSPEKCDNAPEANCLEVNYNVRTAVSYFRDVLNTYHGNVFEAVGAYNGWFRGLTYAEATTWRHGGCCLCQNNLDYLFAFFNGWLLNINAYNPRLGSFFNLDVCR